MPAPADKTSEPMCPQIPEARLYNFLGVPANAPPSVLLASYQALSARIRGANVSYEEPTPESRAAIKAQYDEASLDEAINVLSNPASRARYDARLFAAMPPSPPASASERLFAIHAARPATDQTSRSNACEKRNAPPSIYPDVWIARRDSRITSDGHRWSCPLVRRHRHREQRPRGERWVPRASQGRASPSYGAYGAK